MKCIKDIEKKPVVTKKFIRNLKSKIWKQMTAVASNLYIFKLDERVSKYNKTYHGAIKMKHVDVKVATYIEYGVEHNKKDPKYKVSDHVRISKYKNIFAKRIHTKVV